MAFVEGRGWIAPAPRLVTLSDDELKELERLGQHRANYRGYAKRKDQWGRGLTRSPEFIGLVGEMAMVKYVNQHFGRQILTLDTVDRQYGDPGYDFACGDLTIDIKASRTNGRPLLVRRINERKQIVPLRAAAYALVDAQYPERPEIVGWVRQQKMKTLARSPIRESPHYNLLVLREKLLPIDRLLDAVSSELLKGAML